VLRERNHARPTLGMTTTAQQTTMTWGGRGGEGSEYSRDGREEPKIFFFYSTSVNSRILTLSTLYCSSTICWNCKCCGPMTDLFKAMAKPQSLLNRAMFWRRRAMWCGGYLGTFSGDKKVLQILSGPSFTTSNNNDKVLSR